MSVFSYVKSLLIKENFGVKYIGLETIEIEKKNLFGAQVINAWSLII